MERKGHETNKNQENRGENLQKKIREQKERKCLEILQQDKK